MRPTGGTGLTRRWFLGASGGLALGALGAASCGGPGGTGDTERPAVPSSSGALGANFNGEPTSVTDQELSDLGDKWARGFVPTRELDAGSASAQPTVRRLLDLSAHGYGTVLSLKFPYDRKPIPAPGDAAMRTELRRLDRLLPAVLGKIDILAIGNEPFIESRPADQRSGRLNAFYEYIAGHIVHHGAAGRTRFYMGALNHLENPAAHTAATARWMSFVRKTPQIHGVDIHPHLAEPGTDRAYLDYVLPKLRDDQTFLVTEFSLVRFWKRHLGDRVARPFARRYGIDPSTPVWQVIRQAIDDPFAQRKWTDFLTMTPWLHAHAGYLREQVGRFRKTGKLAVATYGVTQGPSMVKNFTADSTPWLLNSLYCPYTVRRRPDGLPGGNLAWRRQFRDLRTG